MHITADLHMHTHLSFCGQDEATVENYIAQAPELGLTRLGFTDHMWDSAVPGMPWWYRQTDIQNVEHVLPNFTAGRTRTYLNMQVPREDILTSSATRSAEDVF